MTAVKVIDKAAIPAQAEVSHMETKWFRSNPGAGWTATGNTKTVSDGTDQKDTYKMFDSDPGAPWVATGNNETIVDSPAIPAVPEVYGDWSPWATTASGLESQPVLKTNTNTHEYRQLEPVTVSDNNATPAYTVYYTGPGNGPTENVDDAAWTATHPGGDWGQFDGERDGTGIDSYVLFYTGPDSTPSQDEADTVWVDVHPGGDWGQFDGEQEGTGTAVYTQYYTGPESEPSLSKDDAVWIEPDSLEGWTQFDQREITDKAAIPAYGDPDVARTVTTKSTPAISTQVLVSAAVPATQKCVVVPVKPTDTTPPSTTVTVVLPVKTAPMAVAKAAPTMARFAAAPVQARAQADPKVQLQLAHTGVETSAVLFAAFGMMAAGAGAVAVGRKRH